MRLYHRIWRGNNFVQPGAPSGNATAWGENTASSGANIMHSTNPVEDATDPVPDRAAFDENARAARRSWVGSKLHAYYEALVRKFERAGQSELENYLAASQNLAELEDRMRRWERRQSPYY